MPNLENKINQYNAYKNHKSDPEIMYIREVRPLCRDNLTKLRGYELHDDICGGEKRSPHTGNLLVIHTHRESYLHSKLGVDISYPCVPFQYPSIEFCGRWCKSCRS